MDINYQVGYYQKPFGSAFIALDLVKVLHNIRGNNFKKLIDHARLLYNENRNEEYSLFKYSLPAVTFSGTFSPVRNAANLTSYSTLIVIDIDHIGRNLLAVKQLLTEDKYVAAAWISPSGDGLKFLIISPVDETHHKSVYKQATLYFSEILSVPIDTSGSDVSRLCFISHDPDIFINPHFKVFDKFEQEPLTEKPTKHLPDQTAQIKLTAKSPGSPDEAAKVICKRIYHYLKKRNLSITSSYENWVRAAFAISNTFTADYGIRTFLDLCRLDAGQHDEFESEKLIINCYNKGSASSTFKTIIFLAQEQGYQLDFNKKVRK